MIRALAPLSVSLLAATALAPSAQAADMLRRSYTPSYAPTVVEAPHSDKTFAIGVEVGRMSAEGNMTLHYGGHKNSELIWESKDVTTVGVTLDAEVFGGLSTRLRGTFAVTDEGYMEDYDWLSHFPEFGFDSRDWTHLSKHDHTTLDHAVNLDMQVAKRVVGKDTAGVELVTGVRYNDVRWTANGGEFTYSRGSTADGTPGVFRGDKFTLGEEELAGSYQQTYLSPYVGAGASVSFGGFSARAAGILGLPLISSADDDHWRRHLEFDGDFDGSVMTGLEAAAAYTFSDMFSITASARHEYYNEGDSDLMVVDTRGIVVPEFGLVKPVFQDAGPNKVGGEHTQTSFSLGAKYRF